MRGSNSSSALPFRSWTEKRHSPPRVGRSCPHWSQVRLIRGFSQPPPTAEGNNAACLRGVSSRRAGHLASLRLNSPVRLEFMARVIVGGVTHPLLTPRLASSFRGHIPRLLAAYPTMIASDWPNAEAMIDSAAFLVRSSAVGQRWAYVLRVVVAFAWPSERWTVTTSHPAAIRPDA